MNFQIKIKYLYVLSGLIMALLLLLMPGTNTLLVNSILTVCMLFCIFDAFFKKMYLFFLFEVLTTELLAVMLIRSLVLHLSEDSWRVTYNIDDVSNISLRYIAMSLAIIGIVQILGMIMPNKNKATFSFSHSQNLKINNFNPILLFFNGFAVLFLAYFILKAQVFSTRNYAETIDTTFLPIFIMMISVYLFLFKDLLKNIKRNNLISLTTWIVSGCYILVFLIMAFKGYRFLLVQIGTLSFFMYVLNKRRVSIKSVCKLGIIGLVFYVVLILIKTQYLDGQNSNSLLFGHERNIFFSLNAVINNSFSAETNTYLSTLLNLLPKVITGNEHLNVSGIIMQYINPTAYYQTGVTVGAFYLTEAYISFGKVGIFIVSLVISIILLILERMKTKNISPIYVYIYIFIGAQMFNIVYYGSLNYTKQIIYFIIMLLLLRMGRVILFEQKNKVHDQVLKNGQ
ncbi:O-antigen polymerase [Priestia megaterium]|uniref:O-antigen polymerase n=1 Tax=Priestia megaterium TaxID=1404 RepID=UPI0018CE9BD3|nr:O-antigen polymerase [Priestia megaterium]MBG9471678.1 hypothetical protein [Priestia megaterium]